MVMSPGGAALQTFSRADATAARMRRSSEDVVAFTARQAVETEATSPKSSDCSRRASKSVRQSAPSAMATARWVSTTPGSWVCQEMAQSAIASDIAPVRPLRSASSVSSAVPACETRFLPSVVTANRRTERLRCTFKEASSWLSDCLKNSVILPVEEAFYVDTDSLYAAIARRVERWRGSGDRGDWAPTRP